MQATSCKCYKEKKLRRAILKYNTQAKGCKYHKEQKLSSAKGTRLDA